MDAFGLDGLDELVRALIADGHRVIGPRRRDDAIVLADIAGVADLPSGWGVDVAPGRYQIRRRDDDALFGHSAGPQSWKQFVHPPRRKLWETTENGFAPPPPDDRKLAFLGVRGCDLAALGVLDGVLGGNRPRPFVVAVDCTEPGGLCFCASMGTGPSAGAGYDLALTERIDDAGHWFLAGAGSPAGERMLAAVTTRRPATAGEHAAALRDVTAAADHMGRTMPELDLRELLRDSRGAQHWNDVAERCLTCGNCTMVCPTCFCTTTEDVTDLTGDHAERWEHWASCFEVDFSYLHGGSVRTSAASRYRQWLTHKLGTWHDQFGESGCVGCGRCIAWCPAGIDITVEVAALAAERSADDVDV